MKTKFFKFIVLSQCILAMALTARAQFPSFTKIDTGAIYSSTGHHLASGWFDMDNDNDMDVVITNTGLNYFDHPNLMYKNEGHGSFTQVLNTEYTSHIVSAGVPGPFGDIDNDGDVDIINVDWFETDLTLYVNDGQGNLASQNTVTNKGAAYIFFDVDNDSYLDLVQFHQDGGRWHPNDGAGNFSDDNYIELNIPCLDPNATLHNVALGDADNDGDFDLYIGYTDFGGNDLAAKNEFFLNDGAGNFERGLEESVIVEDLAITHCSNWVDYDNDGDMDLYVLNTFNYDPDKSVSGALFENLGDLEFEKHVIEPEEYRDAHRASSVWGDLDNDGDLDLYIPVEKNNRSGHVSPVKHNLLLINNGDGTFTEVLAGTLIEESSHTASLEDMDNDGDLDVLLVRFSWANNGRNTLCMNEGNDNSWLMLNLKGTMSNMSALGAHITARATINGQKVRQTREITPMSGHYTYPSFRVHFGLGDAEVVDTLIIRWPSGHIDEYLNVEANQIYWAVEAEGFYVNRIAHNSALKDIKAWPNPFTNSTTITYELMEPASVMVTIYNQFGEIMTLIENKRSSGRQQVIWNAGGLPAGIYYCVLQSEQGMQTIKLIKI